MSGIGNTLYTVWNQIVYAISNMRIFDIIDIIVIAYIIYKAIGFLKVSRAGQLVKGILLLIFAYAISIWCEFAVLSWLLSLIMNSAIIAVAVIFQPEIRRILERVGQTKLGITQIYGAETQGIDESIDRICKAVGLMHESKTGALIVFERKTQLGDIVNTGTIVDARSSVSIVTNIFFPKSPLHDGAVIVRDGRVYAAGCILPLTQSNTISSSLGTRHRAAIGMSENSDAVVLVVSEETGTISIAVDGQIKRNYSATSAAAELKRYLIDSEIEESDNRIINALKSIKLFSKKKKEVKSDETPKTEE